MIGADGFGFAPGPDGWEKITQLGSVRIGAASRSAPIPPSIAARSRDTLIGDGAVIDNLCQIAHNVLIGEGTAIAGCVGIAGSAVIGAHYADRRRRRHHRPSTIVDGVQVQGRLHHRVDRQARVLPSGTGMMETSLWRRNAVRFGQLDELYKRVVELEKQIKKTKGE